MSNLVIKPGPFSGNNGPEFYKQTESVYERPSVDCKYTIPSPSIAEARNMLNQKLHDARHCDDSDGNKKGNEDNKVYGKILGKYNR